MKVATGETPGPLPPLPTWDSGGHLVDIDDRDALYRAMEEEWLPVFDTDVLRGGR